MEHREPSPSRAVAAASGHRLGWSRWLAAAIALSAVLSACSKDDPTATVPSITTIAEDDGGSTASSETSVEKSALEQGQEYSRCMRENGVANWPDPVATPDGSYGYQTGGVDSKSGAFDAAGEVCEDLLPEWFGLGADLTPSQQQEWLDWAKCVRSNGMPSFADPTFPGGGAVAIADGSGSLSPHLQAAIDACESELPSVGGLGG